MKSLLLSGKVKPNMGGQVLDLYNQQVYQGIAPTMLTTIAFIINDIRNHHEQRNHSHRSQRKEILHPNQEKHSKRLFPTDGSPRSGHRQTNEQGEVWSTHYQQEQTLCPRRKFNSNQLPDRHVRGTDIPLRESLPRQDWSAITLLAYGYFWIYQGRQAYQQSAQSPLYQQDHGTMVQRQPNHRNNARWLMVSTRPKRNVGTINVPVRSHPRLILTFAK